MNTPANIKAEQVPLQKKGFSRLVILGAGESGVGAALLAKQQGYNVFVSDGGFIKELYKIALQKSNILKKGNIPKIKFYRQMK